MARSKGSRKYPRPRRSRQQNTGEVTNGESLLALHKWFLADGSIFAHFKFHGNTSWSPLGLVWLALCWGWSEPRNVTDAFTQAVDCCQAILGSSPLSTYQGFMAAMVRWTSRLTEALWLRLHQKMEEIGGKFWRIGGWVPIAFDGSRSSAPRTVSNEQAYCATNYGKGKTARYRKKKSKGMRRKANQKNRPQPQEPQAWITMLWHMGLRLPWMWRLGPSNSSERAHVIEMVSAGKFPKKTIFCGDAGFVGYPLWSHILNSGADFLVRVGANVSLLRDSADYYCGEKRHRAVLAKSDDAKQPTPLATAARKDSPGKDHGLDAHERRKPSEAHKETNIQILQNALGRGGGVPRVKTNPRPSATTLP